jgi:hypothetical protein
MIKPAVRGTGDRKYFFRFIKISVPRLVIETYSQLCAGQGRQLRDGKIPVRAMIKVTQRIGWMFAWGTFPPEFWVMAAFMVPLAALLV